jgi:hypothetical protein
MALSANMSEGWRGGPKVHFLVVHKIPSAKALRLRDEPANATGMGFAVFTFFNN